MKLKAIRPDIRLTVILVACLGIIGGAYGLTFEDNHWLYSLILGIGLLGSTYGIDLTIMRREDWKLLTWAITVGVVIKAAIPASILCLATGNPRYLIDSISVAQMDPVSVASLEKGSQLSPRGKNLLRGWAALDDPVTVVLTLAVYAACKLFGFDLGLTVDSLQADSLSGLGTYIVHNIAFMTVLVFFWQRALVVKSPSSKFYFAVAFIIGGLIVGATWFWMFGLALLGLFMRPSEDWLLDKIRLVLDRGVTLAFCASAVIVGNLVWTYGVDLVHGILLGVLIYASQAVVTQMAPGRKTFSRNDRVYLALAHQNGVTACSLAIITGGVSIVIVAIVTTHVLNFICNTIARRRLQT